jgi:hypothetical protein
MVIMPLPWQTPDGLQGVRMLRLQLSRATAVGAGIQDRQETGEEKEMMQNPTLTVSTSPHVHAKCDTATIMWMVSAALAPSALWGVYAFGVRLWWCFLSPSRPRCSPNSWST